MSLAVAAVLLGSLLSQPEPSPLFDRVTVPNTEFSFEISDELVENDGEEEEGDEPSQEDKEFNEKYLESQKNFAFFNESGVSGYVSVMKVKPAGVLFPWMCGSMVKEMISSFKEEESELKFEVKQYDEGRFGSRLGYRCGVELNFDGELVQQDMVVVGGKWEVILLIVMSDPNDSSHVSEAKAILDSALYAGKSFDKRRSFPLFKHP